MDMNTLASPSARAAGPMDLSPFGSSRSSIADADQQRLNALRVAGKMLAPIFEAERGDNPHAISLQFTGGAYRVSQVFTLPFADVVTATADTLDGAFTRFLAARSDMIRDKAGEAEDRAEYAAWKAQRAA